MSNILPNNIDHDSDIEDFTKMSKHQKRKMQLKMLENKNKNQETIKIIMNQPGEDHEYFIQQLNGFKNIQLSNVNMVEQAKIKKMQSIDEFAKQNDMNIFNK